nr:D-alanine--D-alanine ligase [Novispirillum itersonii]
MAAAITVTTAVSPHNLDAIATVAEAVRSRRHRKVTVLMGGFSAEREVSLNSGANAVRALETAGYAVQAIDVSRDVGSLLHHLEHTKPDVVFNALHGRYGEDGCVQGMLNILEVPYTHSGLLASSLAMDKPMAKRVFASAGLTVAQDRLVTRDILIAGDPVPLPYVVKPHNEGSSVGVTIVREGDNDRPFARHWPYGPQVMVEEYIPGRELTVAVMDRHALGVTEISTHRGFYDYDAKYASGGSAHTLPADLPEAVYRTVQELAVRAHQALGCRGVSRSDFRYDGTRLVILETNTQPGMTATSLVPEQAALAGIPFPDLCTWMVETAQCDV